MSLPKKCVVDTNVPKTANLSSGLVTNSNIPEDCILACIEAIEHVKKHKALILDDKDEIFSEYMRQLNIKGQPGVGDAFMKWVANNRYALCASQRVAITPVKHSYKEFPTHPDLQNFDRSDRKFVAVANAHPQKPTILQATDCKWWGWKDALADAGVKVHFLCPNYAKDKFRQKMGIQN